MSLTPDTKIDLANLAKGAMAWGGVKAGEVLASNSPPAVEQAGWFVESLALIGIHDWGQASQAAAWFLSVCLIGDFFWKRFFRKYAERRWPKRFPRRRKRRSDFVDSSDHAPLDEPKP
jgi:hypothetical protein